MDRRAATRRSLWPRPDMSKLLLLLLVYACYLQYWTSSTGAPARQRRGVLDLVVTLWCYRERLKVPLLGINLYGCYCGTGGAGAAVDDVDRCCLRHDCCYRYSRLDLRCHGRVKWQLYQFSCGTAHTQCHSSTLCGRMACECDKQFAECLTKAKPKRRHFFYNKKDMCVGPHDVCPELHHNLTAISERIQNPNPTELGPAKSRKKRWRRRKKVAKDETRNDVGRSALWI
ncbi:basic phospholipase A2 taipoxin alpha chain-like isoform X1 [Ranitomeya variabilis]|uniref:basic phospholipase A2 taipoxin alpha chain-like isoform X1 n=1 Tax=Ranitomeya variabilis TaxID=490064 RepID=UPI004056A1FA